MPFTRPIHFIHVAERTKEVKISYYKRWTLFYSANHQHRENKEHVLFANGFHEMKSIYQARRIFSDRTSYQINQILKIIK